VQDPLAEPSALPAAVPREDALAAPHSRAERVAAASSSPIRPPPGRCTGGHCGRGARWCAEQDVDVLAAERVQVERWMRELEERGRAPSTRTGHLSALAGYYAEALDQGAVLRNPAARVRRPRVSHDSPRLGLDRDEARALLRAAERAGRRDHALVSLLLHCGLRVSEAISVSAGDLGSSRGHRVVEVVRKGGARRVLPLPPPAAAAVELLLEELQERKPLGAADPLLVDGAGRRLDRFDAVRIVRRLARAAGIAKVVSPHSLRHTFVTLALDAGASLRDVQDSAGHADPRTTRRYDRGRHSLDRFAGYHVAAYVG
jgi:integrase/recombinase XerD